MAAPFVGSSPKARRIIEIYHEGAGSIGPQRSRNDAIAWVLRTFEEEGLSDPAVDRNWVHNVFSNMSV